MNTQRGVDIVDAVVIGMGVAGESVAGSLAEAGWRVAGIEAGLVGGECPYWGCIPSKMMIRAANALAEARRVDGLAGTATVVPDWSLVAARIREQATDDWSDQVAVDRFEGKGGMFVRGRARIDGPGRVVVDERVLRVERAIVVATGTSPAIPPIPGLDQVDFWTNREAIQAKELPDSLVVLGAGAIGSELGQAMARFGTSVTIVEAMDRMLPREEPEAGTLVQQAFEAEGLVVRVGVMAKEVSRIDNGVLVTLSDGTELRAERLLVATGRRTDVAALGLDTVGVDLAGPFVSTDAHMRVTSGVWAVGDITGEGLFTHVGVYQAGVARADILGEPGPPADYSAVPRVSFTDPEVGAVGLTEAEARAEGLNVETASVDVPATARGWLHAGGNEGVIKLVADADRGVLVGATSVGPHGGEVLAMLTLAVHEATPISRLKRMIYAYPTFHRGVEDALQQL
jgi:pyruvate/2-oxoglutarate dehydrogenase complex dihydrolipoamide dehydrogenase (E3) component